MASTNKKSSVLIIITVCLFIMLGSGGVYTMYITNTIKPDAEVINKLGIIRGSIQRLVKLELGGIQNDELVKDIDADISEFNTKKLRIYDQNKEIQNSLDDLNVSWLQLKEIRSKYIKDPSVENKSLLIKKSEELWNQANNTVLVSQLVSEGKVERYKTSYIFLLINLILVVLIIFLIKRYVKDNLEYMANYDGLTNVYNRRFFSEYFSKELSKLERHQGRLSFIMFDIDNFKRINDTFGHSAGDSVLKELCLLIQVNIRRSDMLSRLGGEEFGVLAPEIGIEDALHISEKLREIVAKHTFKHVGQITISLGVTQFNHGDSIDSIYKRADKALYKAKNNGRNRSEAEN